MADVSEPPAAQPSATRRPAGGLPVGGRGLATIAGLVVLAVLARPWLQQILDQPAIANWATIFVAVVMAAVPFLVLGVAVSGAVTAFVPTRAIIRLLPAHPALAVPVAAVAGRRCPAANAAPSRWRGA